ncbi:cytochrome c oxidase subunit II [Limibacter armeniacum]|uniref:cytochrome c oxidase subunit II n=1 Tax=Limibacter armeniacum TaxID=466084 RepID=UPI002FE53762
MTALLVITGTILTIAVLALVYRIITLVGIAKGDSEQKVGTSNKINAILFPILFFLGFGGIFWYSGIAQEYFLPEAASIHGKETDQLFWVTMGVVFAAFMITHILLFFFPFIYQYNEKRPAHFYPHNDKLEIIWTIVPALVMTGLVLSGWSLWSEITSPASDDAVKVELMGKQFAWEIRYPGKDQDLGRYSVKNVDATNSMGIDFNDKSSYDDFTAREIYLPKGKEVELNIRALDVLHSVFMPHFRVKMDAVPGMPTRFKFTPTTTTKEMREKLNNPKFNFELACTEVCGYGHFGMRKVIVVVEPEEYEVWVASQTPWSEKNADYVSEWKAKKAEKAAVAKN